MTISLVIAIRTSRKLKFLIQRRIVYAQLWVVQCDPLDTPETPIISVMEKYVWLTACASSLQAQLIFIWKPVAPTPQTSPARSVMHRVRCETYPHAIVNYDIVGSPNYFPPVYFGQVCPTSFFILGPNVHRTSVHPSQQQRQSSHPSLTRRVICTLWL